MAFFSKFKVINDAGKEREVAAKRTKRVPVIRVTARGWQCQESPPGTSREGILGFRAWIGGGPILISIPQNPPGAPRGQFWVRGSGHLRRGKVWEGNLISKLIN